MYANSNWKSNDFGWTSQNKALKCSLRWISFCYKTTHDFDTGFFEKYLFLSSMRNVILFVRLPSLWWAAKGQRNWSYPPSTPFYFSPGKDDTRCRRCVLTSGVWNIFWHENCCFISAVSNLTEADDKTTSEAAEATTVLPATVAPVVPQSVQGLWFCHAHYQSRFLLLRQKSQGNAVDWRTLSSSTQCNLTCTISVS